MSYPQTENAWKYTLKEEFIVWTLVTNRSGRNNQSFIEFLNCHQCILIDAEDMKDVLLINISLPKIVNWRLRSEARHRLDIYPDIYPKKLIDAFWYHNHLCLKSYSKIHIPKWFPSISGFFLAHKNGESPRNPLLKCRCQFRMQMTKNKRGQKNWKHCSKLSQPEEKVAMI